MTAALVAGMSWARFCRLLAGLSAESWWWRLQVNGPRRLSARQAERWFKALGA